MFVVIRLVSPIDISPTKKSSNFTKGVSVTYHWMIPEISTRKLTTLRMDLMKFSTSGDAEKQTVTDEEVDGMAAKVITVRLKRSVLREAMTTINKLVETATTTTRGK
jgi:hypothetical protein